MSTSCVPYYITSRIPCHGCDMHQLKFHTLVRSYLAYTWCEDISVIVLISSALAKITSGFVNDLCVDNSFHKYNTYNSGCRDYWVATSMHTHSAWLGDWINPVHRLGKWSACSDLVNTNSILSTSSSSTRLLHWVKVTEVFVPMPTISICHKIKLKSWEHENTALSEKNEKKLGSAVLV